MEYRELGRTGLRVSQMCLGTGGHALFGQRDGIPEAQMHRFVHSALDLGISLFDTSPGYRESEAILGRALAGIPRDRYLLSTKAVFVEEGERLTTPQSIVKSVENSLTRLQTDVIDLLLVGGFVSAETYPRVRDDLVPVVQKLQSDGKIRFWGATEKSAVDGAHEWLARGLQDDLFDVAMVAYNMINQSAERSVFPLCQRQNVGVMAIYVVREVFSKPQRLREVIDDLKERGLLSPDALTGDDPMGWLLDYRTPVSEIINAAYRFVAHHDAVSTVMTGALKAAHLAENLQTVAQPPLPKAQLEHLKTLFGHISEPIGN